MLIKVLFLLLIPFLLYCSDILKSTYYIQSDDINLSHIVPHAKMDTKLFSIEENKYTKRLKSKELIQVLKQYGYNSFSADSRYIKFIKKSPIDLSKIERAIEEAYTKQYENIDIQKISVLPRGYIDSLPEKYTISLTKKAHLSRRGTLYIKTNENKKIFFNYIISANVSVCYARNDINKDEELSQVNTMQKSIVLDKFRAMPVQKIQQGVLQSKHNLQANSIITTRDVQRLNIIIRGSNVNVSFQTQGMAIEFSAKALQDGKLNDIITVEKSNTKKIKVRVIGKNQAEMI
ncbi:flagellar basal body P-ring formation chaperone FlgA [bacterium]|nr:flagellar basal body P-ring formation chaperone FlgA [bacterium]MBU1995426.1 flagellar basal body P-ring formation chaperone FlgA [bacterium]